MVVSDRIKAGLETLNAWLHGISCMCLLEYCLQAWVALQLA